MPLFPDSRNYFVFSAMVAIGSQGVWLALLAAVAMDTASLLRVYFTRTIAIRQMPWYSTIPAAEVLVQSCLGG